MPPIVIASKLLSYYYKDNRGPNSNGPGTCGLVLHPNGDSVWLNGRPRQVTNQVKFDGPIVGKIRELVKRQEKTVIIPFGDEEPFYLMPWWSRASANIGNNDRTWVRNDPIIDNEKYELYEKFFGPDFIILTVTLYKGRSSFPNVKTIPWNDEIYTHGPYRNLLAREILPEIPYANKKDQVVWRGGGFTHHINCGHPRLKIEEKLKPYGWANVKHNDSGWNNSGDNYLDFKDCFAYKINMIIDGVAGATSERWIFLTGSVILRVSDWESCVVQQMKPWYDYIPVKLDLSDLIENVEWIFTNPKKAEKIAQQGRQTYVKYTSRVELDKVIHKALDIKS